MADVFESWADKTERFAFIPLFQLIDAFNRFFIQNVTANAVVGVGRIDDDTALFQDIDRYLDESILGVDWIYFDQHMFTALPSGAGCPVKPAEGPRKTGLGGLSLFKRKISGLIFFNRLEAISKPLFRWFAAFVKR